MLCEQIAVNTCCTLLDFEKVPETLTAVWNISYNIQKATIGKWSSLTESEISNSNFFYMQSVPIINLWKSFLMIVNCSISPESLSIQCLQDEIQRKSPKYKTSAGL